MPTPTCYRRRSCLADLLSIRWCALCNIRFWRGTVSAEPRSLELPTGCASSVIP